MVFPDHTDLPFDQLLDVKGKIAVVTGASSGIGEAVARRLSEAGAVVYGADLSPGFEDETPIPAVLDVTDRAAIEHLVDRVVAEHGFLDIWVNSAGIFPPGDFLQIDDDAWKQVLDVNLSGVFIASQAAGRVMAGKGGVIVNISSIGAYRAGQNPAHYRATKAGVHALTETIARELGPMNVRAVAIAPTVTKTEGFKRTAGSEADEIMKFGDVLPAGRVAVADDVARAVLFAVSPLGSFITGSVIAVDGGHLVV